MLVPQVNHIILSFLCCPDSSGYIMREGIASSGDYTSLPRYTG